MKRLSNSRGQKCNIKPDLIEEEKRLPSQCLYSLLHANSKHVLRMQCFYTEKAIISKTKFSIIGMITNENRNKRVTVFSLLSWFILR